MKIHQLVDSVADLIEPDILRSALELPVRLSPEKFLNGIPCIEIKKDGLALSSVVLVSDALICEVRLKGAGADFDFIRIDTIENYRVSLFIHEQKTEAVVVASYEVAQVKLLHGFQSCTTVLSYVGKHREEWLKDVLTLLPVSVVMHQKGTEGSQSDVAANR